MAPTLIKVAYNPEAGTDTDHAFAHEAAAERCARELVEAAVEHLVESMAVAPKAIILTGSFARGEGSVQLCDHHAEVLGDMEMMVVVPASVNRVALQQQLDREACILSSRVAQNGTRCHFEFRAVTATYFRQLAPRLFAYELLSHGRTVFGDRGALPAQSHFPAVAIPRWEGWQLIGNRLIEQIEAYDGLRDGDLSEVRRAYYNIIKLYLDLATAILLIAGRYRGTYRGRALELLRWAEDNAQSRELPAAAALADAIEQCTHYKLYPNTATCPFGVRLDTYDCEQLRSDVQRAWLNLIPHAIDVWSWAAQQITGEVRVSEIQSSTLARQVLSSQTAHARLRAWAKLALMPAVRSQPGFWGRILRFLPVGSPRYLMYCCAAGLLAGLPDVLAGRDIDVAAFESYLPVRFAQHETEPCPWRRLRANVLSGWRIFLRNHST